MCELGKRGVAVAAFQGVAQEEGRPEIEGGHGRGRAQLIVTEYAPGSMPDSTLTCPGTPTETNSRAPRRKRNSRVASAIRGSGQSDAWPQASVFGVKGHYLSILSSSNGQARRLARRNMP
jgi:hypothetical protein